MRLFEEISSLKTQMNGIHIRMRMLWDGAEKMEASEEVIRDILKRRVDGEHSASVRLGKTSSSFHWKKFFDCVYHTCIDDTVLRASLQEKDLQQQQSV